MGAAASASPASSSRWASASRSRASSRAVCAGFTGAPLVDPFAGDEVPRAAELLLEWGFAPLGRIGCHRAGVRARLRQGGRGLRVELQQDAALEDLLHLVGLDEAMIPRQHAAVDHETVEDVLLRIGEDVLDATELAAVAGVDGRAVAEGQVRAGCAEVVHARERTWPAYSPASWRARSSSA